jgi:hypothetical protein
VRPSTAACVEVRVQNDQRIRDNQRINVEETPSEMKTAIFILTAVRTSNPTPSEMFITEINGIIITSYLTGNIFY